MGMIILNGKEYTSMPKDGFPPIIYSDEEREIGVWRDGKPLYQKTINIGSLPNNSSKSITHNISNLDRIVNSFGYAQNNDWRIPIPTVSGSTTSSQVEIFVNSTIISIADGTDRSDYSGFVTLQYTKTTDTPGSGKYTTYGGLTHHYSTSEQVVGTWVDGKPLYEKTYLGLNVSNDSGSWVSISSINVSFIEQIIDAKVTASGGQLHNVSAAKDSNNNVAFRIGYSTNNITGIVLQYTKTTD